MRKFIQISIIAAAIAIVGGCLGPSEIQNASANLQGNEVKTIIIGNQEWMAENLNTDKFANGDPILHAKTDKEWEMAGQSGKPAWCYFNNDPKDGKKYGKLYNWYAVSDARGLAPKGWKVPADEDWKILIKNIGNTNNAGYRLKSTEDWLDNGNGEITNGFNAYPTGGRYNSGIFSSRGTSAFFWSASDHLMFYGRYFVIHHNKKEIGHNSLDKNYGFSVRCVRDLAPEK